jgi:hypothetical protein
MVEEEEMGWEEKDLTKVLKILAGTTTIPFKVTADIAGEVKESVGAYIPTPSKLASSIIDTRINILKTITRVIEKEIDLLGKYKEELAAKEEKKEKVKVE